LTSVHSDFGTELVISLGASLGTVSLNTTHTND